jgi:hypothetical protein
MSQPADQSLSQDVVFDLLSSSRRRFVLQYLSQHEGPVAFSELANELAAWENDTEVENITERRTSRSWRRPGSSRTTRTPGRSASARECGV